MKSSILFTALTTVALSLGSVSANSPSSLEKRREKQNEQNNNYHQVQQKGIIEFYDPPNIREKALDCNGIYFTKPEAYAAVYHARQEKLAGRRKVFCVPSYCREYPSEFVPNLKNFDFRVKGSLSYFPLLPNGKLYNGGYTGKFFVVFDQINTVAGIFEHGAFKMSKCLYNDRIPARQASPRTPYLKRLRNHLSTAGQKVSGVFSRKNPGNTASINTLNVQSDQQELKPPKSNSVAFPLPDNPSSKSE